MERLAGSINKGIEDNSRLIRTNENGELCVVPPTAGSPFRFFLTESGDGTGNNNLNGNYSASPVDFFYTATAVYDIYTLLIAVSDDGTLNQAAYGAISGGLTNGVLFFVETTPGVETSIVTTNPIKHNYDFLSNISDTKLTNFSGTPQTLVSNLNIKNEFGMPFTIQPGWKVIVRLNDDFSTLVSHTFGLRGILQAPAPI